MKNIFKRKKAITYNITDAEVLFVQSHTLNFMYGKTIYWVYSSDMEMYYPYLMQKKRARVPLRELLIYCRNHHMFIYPMTLRKSKFMTRIAMKNEMLKINNIGLAIRSTRLIRLINEYAKYCLVNYPVKAA